MHLLTYEKVNYKKFENMIDDALFTFSSLEKKELFTFVTTQISLNETPFYYQKIWDEAKPMFYLSGKNAHKNFFLYLFDKYKSPNEPSLIRF